MFGNGSTNLFDSPSALMDQFGAESSTSGPSTGFTNGDAFSPASVGKTEPMSQAQMQKLRGSQYPFGNTGFMSADSPNFGTA